MWFWDTLSPFKSACTLVLMLTGAQLCFEVYKSLEELKKEELKKGSLQRQIWIEIRQRHSKGNTTEKFSDGQNSQGKFTLQLPITCASDILLHFKTLKLNVFGKHNNDICYFFSKVWYIHMQWQKTILNFSPLHHRPPCRKFPSQTARRTTPACRYRWLFSMHSSSCSGCLGTCWLSGCFCEYIRRKTQFAFSSLTWLWLTYSSWSACLSEWCTIPTMTGGCCRHYCAGWWALSFTRTCTLV